MQLMNDKQTRPVSFGKRCKDVMFLALNKQVEKSALRFLQHLRSLKVRAHECFAFASHQGEVISLSVKGCPDLCLEGPGMIQHMVKLHSRVLG